MGWPLKSEIMARPSRPEAPVTRMGGVAKIIVISLRSDLAAKTTSGYALSRQPGDSYWQSGSGHATGTQKQVLVVPPVVPVIAAIVLGPVHAAADAQQRLWPAVRFRCESYGPC